jgi:hypothetical protein
VCVSDLYVFFGGRGKIVLQYIRLGGGGLLFELFEDNIEKPIPIRTDKYSFKSGEKRHIHIHYIQYSMCCLLQRSPDFTVQGSF